MSHDLIITMDNVFVDVNGALEKHLRSRKFEFNMANVRTYDFNKNSPSSFAEFFLDASYATISKALCDIELLKTAKIDEENVQRIKTMAKKGTRILVLETFRSDKVKEFKTALFSKIFGEETNIEFEIHPYDAPFRKMIKPDAAIITDNPGLIDAYPVTSAKYLIDKPYNQEEYNNKYIKTFKSSTCLRCSNTEMALRRFIETKLQN